MSAGQHLPFLCSSNFLVAIFQVGGRPQLAVGPADLGRFVAQNAIHCTAHCLRGEARPRSRPQSLTRPNRSNNGLTWVIVQFYDEPAHNYDENLFL